MSTFWNQEKAYLLIPEHMHGGLQRWIDHGIPPGDFLTAVLSNDLKGAFMRADGINSKRIGDYVMYLYNYAPRGCWGSRENFEKWAEYHRSKIKE